ncbi:type VII secretion protein EsaA [Oceanobacillus bengalensis]|uniref:Type VII secretion system accessory factor EsaA n=1 Tax=Oceanobacillus bengalensis TaxID=1435466 RepID=A0A494Z323_9BACI|nr:type VII secretion protein EsaA [Oceanobacillus bengalensis]RKQ16837.1 type VII secretion protein EsaA [Oceanobacillus bengalensis]
MKIIDKRWLVFIVLIIILASGLSFLALNQESHSTQVDNSLSDTTRMNIALVNEDRGAVFNNGELAFGDAFVKSLDKNDNHEWYVVSRGIAESGLENNQYDMMIVIPNDFSEKALSIESEAPEQVVLNYKINTSNNEKVKTEAEKTASTILNDFNRQIIDVYFASIIGNLQVAQDNIANIVDKQRMYTNTYNNEIYSPLDSYTSQFSSIKDNTQISKDRFSGFEETMENYETQLVEGTELEQNYLSTIKEVSELGESNSLVLLDYYDSFNQFNHALNHNNVESKLQELQASNRMIQDQFHKRDNVPVTTYSQIKKQEDNIVSGVAALQTHLQTSLTKVEKAQQLLEASLNPEGENSFQDNVRERLETLFSTAFTEDDQLNINKLFENPDGNVRSYINEQIRRLPSLNVEEFEGYDLPSETLTDIKNVIAVTNKYNQEMEYVKPDEEDEEILSEYINRLKDQLANNGVTMRDTVILPENKESDQLFTLNIPEGFSIKKLELTLPGGKNITVHDLEDNKLILPKNKEGQFSVELTLLLNDIDKKLNVFKPLTWSWEINQEYTTKDTDSKPEIDESDDISDNESNAKEDDSEIIRDDNTQRDENTSTNSVGETSENEKQTEVTSVEETTETDLVNEENPSSEEAESEGTDEVDSINDDSDENVSDNEVDSGDINVGKDNANNNDTSDTEDESNESSDETENKNENGEDKDENQEPQEPQEPIVEKVKEINNTIHHKVMNSIDNMDNVTKDLYQRVINTVSPYEKLFTMYEIYFGFDMDSKELIEELSDNQLTDLASGKELSLYYLFNEKDIAELLQDYVVKQVTADVTEEIRNPLEKLQERIQLFHLELNTANQNVDNLAARVDETTNQAAILNENLEGLLGDVANWRENSLNLVEQQNEVVANDDSETTAILNLGNEFQPLLTKSELLANQAETNVNSAEGVYETFDTIDQQADVIQTSGVNIVTQAEVLSENMTNKLLQDQDFASNFADVLANSRIGERQNENLYDFLSNPVLTSNEGTIRGASTSDTFTPYYLVLICFIIVLFTAYVISTLYQKKSEGDQFETEKTLISLNTPITIVTAGIGVLEGIIVGVVSSYYLPISDANMILLIALIILLTTAMLLIATYLLRQLRMIGMFLLLTVLSLYLFLTDALGATTRGMEFLEIISPLQYVEALLNRLNQGTVNYFISFLVIIGMAILGVFANLLVVRYGKQKGDLDEDERKTEAI